MLYGTGSFSASVANALLSVGIRPVALVDHTPARLNTFDSGLGLTVEPPESALRRFPDATVILGIFNGYADIHAIGESLVELGASSIMTALQFYDAMRAFGVEMPESYWMASTSTWQVPAPETPQAFEVERARGLLGDDRSISIFDETLRWRRLGRWDTSPVPEPLSFAYTSEDLDLPRDEIHFVDVGAYTGDSIRSMKLRGFSFSRVTALEPDPNNFSRLAKYMREHAIPGEALPLALSDAHRQVTFAAAGDSSSRIVDSGDTHVTAAPLDDLLIDISVDYVKMDIEGAETSALKGMSRIIREQSPVLAVCVYHRPHDLWSVPLWLADLQPKYSFHLRVYCHQGFELVLYAIPA